MESQKDSVTFSVTQFINVGIWVVMLNFLFSILSSWPLHTLPLGNPWQLYKLCCMAKYKLPVHIFIPPVFLSMVRHLCLKILLSKGSYYWISTLFKLFVHYSSSSRFSSSIHSFPTHMYILWRTPCKATLSKIWSLPLEEEEAITYLAWPRRRCQHLGCLTTVQGPGSGGGGAASWAEAWRRVRISRIRNLGGVGERGYNQAL